MTSSRDTLTGGTGSDTFVFHANEALAAANADKITDFQVGPGGDVLNVADVLAGHGYAGGSLADYIHISATGVVSIDANGTVGGAHFINIATSSALIGHTADDLLATGNIVAM